MCFLSCPHRLRWMQLRILRMRRCKWFSEQQYKTSFLYSSAFYHHRIRHTDSTASCNILEYVLLNLFFTCYAKASYFFWDFLGVWIAHQLTSARRKTVFPIDLVAGGFREGNDAFQLYQPYDVTWLEWLAWCVCGWLGVLRGVLKHNWTADFYLEVWQRLTCTILMSMLTEGNARKC